MLIIPGVPDPARMEEEHHSGQIHVRAARPVRFDGRADGGGSGPTGTGGGAGGVVGTADGGPSSGGRSPIEAGADGFSGSGGVPPLPPTVCDPLVEAGTLFGSSSCGQIERASLPPGPKAPYGPSGPVVLSGGGIAILRSNSSGDAIRAVDLFDRSARCLATLGTEEHAFNRYAGVVDAETRGEVAAVLVSCDSAQGPCGSTLYVNGRLAFDMTEYPTDPIVSTYTKMTVDPEGNVLLVTDSARIGRDIEHRVRLVRYDGAVLKDTNLPPDRFSTVDVAADRQGRFVIAMAGQPAAGQARSTLQVVDHDLARLSFAPMREDIEINALWADSADTVIAVGQEGSPDPYGYVEALSIPGLAPVWPVHPKFPLGYAHAVDVGKDGLVWVVGDDPNDTVWLASYNPTTQVVIVAPPRPASADDPFATWSLTALDDGTVLFAHDSVYSYCP